MTAEGRWGVALPVPRNRARLKSQSPLDRYVANVPGVDHVIDELFAQSPHLQTDPDRNQSKENLEPPHPPDGSSESLDILLVLVHELGREKVGPELNVSLATCYSEPTDLVSLSERYLKIDRLGFVSLLLKLMEGMPDVRFELDNNLLVDITSSLDTLVHPWWSVSLLVNRDGECLTTTVALCIWRSAECTWPDDDIMRRTDQGSLEFIWMIGEGVCAWHARWACSYY
jgi:hypothetical protein